MPKKYHKKAGRFIQIAVICCLGFALGSCKKSNTGPTQGRIGEGKQYKPEEIQPGVIVGSIYYTGGFNAFTDLIYHQNKWFCVFREGSQHVGGKHGVIKLLVSNDGQYWKVDQEIRKDSIDFRDPKLVVDSSANELHLTFFGIDYRVGTSKRIRNYFTNYIPAEPHPDVVEIDEQWPNNSNYYMWRWTSAKSENYCMAYRISKYEDTTTNLILMSGKSRYRNRKIIKNINILGQPTETTIRFEGNRMYAAVRLDISSIYLGYADYPYSNFTWVNNTQLPKLASPNFLFYKSHILITGRDLSDSKFKFYALNRTTNQIDKTISFVGGYEVGYAGMVFNPADPNELWLSYYSIDHGGVGSNIYLSKLNLNRVLQ